GTEGERGGRGGGGGEAGGGAGREVAAVREGDDDADPAAGGAREQRQRGPGPLTGGGGRGASGQEAAFEAAEPGEQAPRPRGVDVGQLRPQALGPVELPPVALVEQVEQVAVAGACPGGRGVFFRDRHVLGVQRGRF